MKAFENVFKFLASLKFAVVVIVSIGVIAAVGTFYEAKYDALVAQKLVYQSIYMYMALAALSISLIFVMIDRWPWRPHHAGFVLAHIGILILLAGALVTQIYGIDGSLQIPIGGVNRQLILPDTRLSVYSSFEGDRFVIMHDQPVDFIKRPPQEEPVRVHLGGDEIVVDDYYHFAARKEDVVATTDKSNGPGMRFQLQNERVNMTHWLVLPRGKDREEVDLGPAKIIVTRDEKYREEGRNHIVLVPGENGVKAIVYSQKERAPVRGQLQAGDVLKTGWMNLELRLLKFLPFAETKVEYTKRDSGTDLTTSAIRVKWQGKDHWIGLNSFLRVFTQGRVYVITFNNRRLDLGFNVKLNKFDMGKYQGTNRAASYASTVQIDGGPEVVISMNNPLKHNGYTLYQASFSSDESGTPMASVLSINRDPGRPLKYLGSLLIVFGAIVLIYFKKVIARREHKRKAA